MALQDAGGDDRSMEKTDTRQTAPARSHSLREAIRQARIKEAETIDRVADRRSSELARLEVLKAGLEGIFDEIPATEDRFDLALVPSLPARLWIDMFTYVTMDAASEVYRLIRNGREGRRVIAEARDVAEIGDRITEYIAQQIVARERQLDGMDEVERRAPPIEVIEQEPRSGAGLAIGAFLIGFLTAVLGIIGLIYVNP